MAEPDEYAWQQVTCTRCKRTYRCTPLDDFMQPAPDLDWDEGRVCEKCLLELSRRTSRRVEEL